MKLILLALVALIAFALPGVAMAQEEELEPLLSLSKSATAEPDVGTFAGFNIVAVNSGDLGADIEIRDQLPAGYDWLVTGISGDITCDLSETMFLLCSGHLAERQLEKQDDGQTIFVNGSASVNVRAYQHSSCVNLGNLAVLIGGGELLSASATLSVPCPATPTPTATSTPTATPTATSTATPTNTPEPTQTPVVIPATPTPRFGPNNPAPGPPDTGTGTAESKSHALLLLFASLGLGAFAFGIGGAAIARRSR